MPEEENKAAKAAEIIKRNNEFLSSKFGEAGARPISSIGDMISLGLASDEKTLTPEGRRYKALVDNQFINKDGTATTKGVAFTTPTSEILPTDKIVNFTSTLDPNDPEVLNSFELWKIQDDNKLNKPPEDEGNAVMNIFKGVGEMAKAIGVSATMPEYTPEQKKVMKEGGIIEALGEAVSPKGGYTKEQRLATLAKAAEGAAETAVTSSGKLGAFIDQNIINPARKLAGATDEEIKADDQFSKFQVATRGALYDKVTAAAAIDAVTGANEGSQLFSTAENDFVKQLGEVKGKEEFLKVMNGAQSVGGMLGDPVGLALTGGTMAFGKLINLARAERIAKAAKNADVAALQLSKLDEAAAITGKKIEDATTSAAAIQKRMDDALAVGNTEVAMAAKSQLDEISNTIKTSQDRMNLLNDGIKVNQEMLQKATSKIDDINAPSMLARQAGSATIKGVADAADTLGNGFVWTNKKLRAIERGIGMGRLPFLVHAAGLATLGTAYKIYGGIRVGSLIAAPLIKKTAGFANVVGEEMLQLTNSSPFWRRVAANENAGRMTQAFGGLMDYTTPITRGVVGAAKGTAQALPAMTLYEAINSQGLDENAMKRAGAGAFVFGSFGRAIGSRNNWSQVKNNEFYNFRNKVKATNPEGFQQFEAVPYRDVKQFASSIDAAYPGMFDSWNFVKEGNSKFDPVNKQATVNYNDRAGIVKAAAAHEALHGIQFKHQSDGAVASLMLGDETRKGLVRDTDGNLNPEFKQFWDEYNSRLDAQGLPKIDINDAAIEYFTDNGAQTLFEDVMGGSLYKASQKTPLRRSIESVFKSTMAATPIVKNLHFKLGGATDNLGRMVDGSGLLAKGMKELPEVKSMIRNMYRESAGLPKQAPKPQIIKDAPSQDPKHYKGAEIIRKANEEAVQGGTPLPDNVLNPDANGNGFGYLTDVAIKRLEESGVIADGDFAGVIAINSAMGTPSSYLLTNKPIEQGRSVQVEGITSNNIVPINWELKNGRLYLVGMDMVQLKLNIAKAAKSSIAKKLDMKYADILNDIDNSALLHAKNQTTDAYFQSKDPKNWEKRKNFINSVQGLLTESQRKINPLFDKRNLNKVSGIYRTFAWDRLGDKIQMTGEVAIPYGQNSYYSLRDNLMPQPPRMNRNGDLVKDSFKTNQNLILKEIQLPENASGSRIKTQLKFNNSPTSFQFEKGIVASPGVRYLPQKVYHGTPYNIDRFSVENVGTGEGAQAFGWGLYFAESADVANYYAIKVGSKPSKELLYEIVDSGLQDMTVLAKKMRSEGKSEKLISEAERLGSRKKGNLYTVELNPDSNQFLDWNLPLKEQSENIQKILTKIDKDTYSSDSVDYDANELGQLTYSRISGSPKDKSKKLLSSGIKGIRYFDGESKNRPYKEIKKEFLKELPQDASIEDVNQAINDGAFNPEQKSFFKALESDDWLGFEYPSQAISAALSENITNWDPSQALIDSIARLRKDVTYNYVVFDDNDIKIIKENEREVQKQNEKNIAR